MPYKEQFPLVVSPAKVFSELNMSCGDLKVLKWAENDLQSAKTKIKPDPNGVSCQKALYFKNRTKKEL